MRVIFGLPMLLASALSFPVTTMRPAEAGYTDAQLDALDPTRIGRLACRGSSSAAALLETRLRQAQRYSENRHLGSGPIKLFSGMAPTDIPAPELQGLAARYFAQGLALAFGFNHKAAIRSFRMAQDADPKCALCFWGEAFANGPNINAGMDSEQNKAALAALDQAKVLASSASPVAQQLIEAQAFRYGTGGGERAALDVAYAKAMAQVAEHFADSNDISVLAAEAAMNTSPWDYWEAPDKPRPQIAGAIAEIEKVIARSPQHPQASHLYIHLMEATQPGNAVAAADRLAGGSAPAALGHLVHMPSHIYYRVGRYRDSMKANILAVRADEAYLAEVGDDGLYRYGYYPHNVHFLLTSAQMAGDMRRTITEAQRLSTVLDIETARDLPWVQAIHAAPAFALAQFESPDAILALTTEPSQLSYVEAMRNYARAIAYAQKDDRDGFAESVATIERLATAPETLAMVNTGFPAPDLVKMAALVARARMEQWRGRNDAAVGLFSRAEAIQATIPYNEPPYWYYPVAQSRGAALFALGRYAEAREAFLKALFMAPNDGWALFGLARTEARLGRKLEAAAARSALSKVWLGEPGWLQMNRL